MLRTFGANTRKRPPGVLLGGAGYQQSTPVAHLERSVRVMACQMALLRAIKKYLVTNGR